MAQTRRTAQRAEIVPSGFDSGRDIVTIAVVGYPIPIEQMMGMG